MQSTKIIRALVALSLLVAAPGRAAPTGGLASPVGAGGFAVSAGLAYAQRDLEDGSDDEVTNRRVLFRAQYGPVEWLDLYAILGFTDAELDDEDFEGSLGGTFGLGAHVQALHFPDSAVKIVLDLQGEYFRSEDGSKRVKTQAYHGAAYVVKEIGAAGRVGYFYPYGGIRVSYAHHDVNKGIEDLHAEDLVGLFGGVDYFVNPNVYFAGEIHLFDETSLFLGVGYRF